MAVQLVEEDVLAALQNKLGTKDFVVDSWKQISAMEDGRLGFLGDHFKIEAFVRHPASAPKAELQSMFVKSLPRNPRARATVVDAGVFKKEALFYKLVSKDIAEAAAREREPGFQPFVYPPCYLIKDDCLLLEDLSPFQFKGTEARKPLPIEHARLVVRALGEMHGGSLLLEERRGRTILEQFPDLDYETFFVLEPGHPNMSWHNASIKLCHDIIPHLDKYKDDPATVKRIQAAMPDLIKEVFGVLSPWPGVRNVVNHGDVWVNNLMFRYDKSGRPVEVACVDFQLVRYSPPASDLLFFITFCTDRALQEKHLGELTRLHWDSIADTLRRGGCDPDKVLPWSEFEEVAKKMWKYGLILMSIEYPFALAPASLMDPLLEDPEKFYHHCHVDRSEPLIKVYHEDAIFHSRYNEIMERLIDGYILNKP